jgi:hypothetical protein
LAVNHQVLDRLVLALKLRDDRSLFQAQGVALDRRAGQLGAGHRQRRLDVAGFLATALAILLATAQAKLLVAPSEVPRG